MAVVRIKAWRTGMRKISVTKALQEHAKMSLTDAKSITDAILAGARVELEIADGEVASSLAESLQSLGAEADVVTE